MANSIRLAIRGFKFPLRRLGSLLPVGNRNLGHNGCGQAFTVNTEHDTANLVRIVLSLMLSANTCAS